MATHGCPFSLSLTYGLPSLPTDLELATQALPCMVTLSSPTLLLKGLHEIFCLATTSQEHTSELAAATSAHTRPRWPERRSVSYHRQESLM